MKPLIHLILLMLLLTPCQSEVLWHGGGKEGRLTLASGKNPIGGWNSPNGDELRFIIRRHANTSILYPGGRVGEVTGLLREGLAAGANERIVRVDECTINFQKDGTILITFVFHAKEAKTEYPILLTRSEARKLVQVAGRFFDERMARHAEAEKHADLD